MISNFWWRGGKYYVKWKENRTADIPIDPNHVYQAKPMSLGIPRNCYRVIYDSDNHKLIESTSPIATFTNADGSIEKGETRHVNLLWRIQDIGSKQNGAQFAFS